MEISMFASLLPDWQIQFSTWLMQCDAHWENKPKHTRAWQNVLYCVLYSEDTSLMLRKGYYHQHGFFDLQCSGYLIHLEIPSLILHLFEELLLMELSNSRLGRLQELRL